MLNGTLRLRCLFCSVDHLHPKNKKRYRSIIFGHFTEPYFCGYEDETFLTCNNDRWDGSKVPCKNDIQIRESNRDEYPQFVRGSGSPRLSLHSHLRWVGWFFGPFIIVRLKILSSRDFEPTIDVIVRTTVFVVVGVSGAS